MEGEFEGREAILLTVFNATLEAKTASDRVLISGRERARRASQP